METLNVDAVLSVMLESPSDSAVQLECLKAIEEDLAAFRYIWLREMENYSVFIMGLMEHLLSVIENHPSNIALLKKVFEVMNEIYSATWHESKNYFVFGVLYDQRGFSKVAHALEGLATEEA